MNLTEQDKEDITDMIIDSRDIEETADEMFEKLGYYKDFDNIIHEYRKEEDGNLFEIDFWLEDKEVSKNYYREAGNITMQELKAINKKVEELRLDIENIRSFLLKLESGRVLRLVEKENYDKLVKRIKELEEENRIYVQKVKDKIEKHKFVKKEFEKEYDSKNYKDDSLRARDFYMIVAEDLIIKNLEELLEDK